MSVTAVIILLLSGLVVGFVNTLSAGGTTLSIAVYLALGIPPLAANAINRIGVLMQNGFATALFAARKQIQWNIVLWYSLPVCLGSLTGSLLAVEISERIFSVCFGVILLVMLFMIFSKKFSGKGEEYVFSSKKFLIHFPFFFLTGLYGGFAQSGTGFLLMACGAWLLNYNFIRITATKNALMFVYTCVALVVFFLRGGVDVSYWLYGFIHAIGCIIGSWIAARWALNKGEFFVKAVILCVVIMTSLSLFGVLDLKIIFKNLLQ